MTKGKWLTISICGVYLFMLGPAVGQGAEGRRILLDERSYLRAYYRLQRDYLNPELMANQADALFPVSRLRSGAEEWREQVPYMQDKDWTYHALARHPLVMYPVVHTPHPPIDWMDPDFDDRLWLRRIAPVQVGVRRAIENWTQEAYPHFQTSYFRAYVDIENPRQVGDLLLDLQYRGGVRVFVNGREVVRAHLPDGEIGPETLAEGYPPEAYVGNPAKVAERNVRRGDLVGDIPIDSARSGREEQHASMLDRLYQLRERHLKGVRIPAELLRAGSNVLAIELRRAQIHPVFHHEHEYAGWPHARLASFTLSADAEAGGYVDPNQRPAGVQVWFEDMARRVVNRDYLEPGAPQTRWRLSGARNGRYAGQLVIGTDRALTGLNVEVSHLRVGGGGQEIHRDAIRIYGTNPRSKGGIGGLGGARGQFTAEALPYLMLSRYAERGIWDLPVEEQNQVIGRVQREVMHYDHLLDDVQNEIVADTAHPVWLSLHIPEETEPGRYMGAVRVSADGMEPVVLPIELEVIDWRMPDPQDFQTVVAIDSEFWHLPGMLDVGFWSEEHWAAIRRTYRLLSMLGGGQWIEIPVSTQRYGGGVGRELIQWIRQPDESMTFDFTHLDRYLQIVLEEVGRPRVIAFTSTIGMRGDARIAYRDAGAERHSIIDLGAGGSPERREQYWGAYAVALQQFMHERGLADVMHWGTPGDNVADPELISLLDRFAPGVPWARASHDSMPDNYFRAVSVVYGPNYLTSPVAGDAAEEQQRLLPDLLSIAGWRQDAISVLNPRTFTSVHYCEGYFNLHAFRHWPERALIAGYRGIGLAGADGWYRGRNSRIEGVMTAVVRLYWQGENGVDDTMRAHGLLEGIQTTEARIFLEQALAGGQVSPALEARAIEVLNDYVYRNALTPRSHQGNPTALVDLPQDWPLLHRNILQVAAQVAQAVGMSTADREHSLSLAQGERHRHDLTLFGWTSRPREWEVREAPAWLRVAEASGALRGREALPLLIDLSNHRAGEQLTGRLVLADREAGRAETVDFTVAVKHQVEVEGRTPHLFVPEGGERVADYRLVNYSNEPVDWQLSLDGPWLDIQPRAGRLEPNARAVLRAVADASTMRSDASAAAVRVLDGSRREILQTAFYGYIDRPAAPVPSRGGAVHLAERYDLLYEHHTLTRGGWRTDADGPRRDALDILTAPFTRRADFPGNNEDIGFDISGGEFDTLVTGIRYTTDDAEKGTGKVRMRIYTDGQLRFDSGLIEPGEKEIPVVVRHLQGVRHLHFYLYADEVKRPSVHGQARWVAPRLYPAAR